MVLRAAVGRFSLFAFRHVALLFLLDLRQGAIERPPFNSNSFLWYFSLRNVNGGKVAPLLATKIEARVRVPSSESRKHEAQRTKLLAGLVHVNDCSYSYQLQFLQRLETK